MQPVLVARLSLNRYGATSNDGRAGLIGPGVLERFTFICDYSRHRLIFEKNSQFEERDVYDRAGMWISQKGDLFEVFDVMSGGPASMAGLRPGDLILEVNGKNTGKLLLTDVRDKWKISPPGTVFNLLIQSPSGQTHSARLILEDLV